MKIENVYLNRLIRKINYQIDKEVCARGEPDWEGDPVAYYGYLDGLNKALEILLNDKEKKEEK